jgi:predicted RNA-binding protein associated with RNAse of E/G family
MKIQKKDPAGNVLLEYEGEILRRDENSITLEAIFQREDMPFMDIVIKKGDRFVETFYLDRWYNIFEIHDRDDGRFKGWYCNVGKPAQIYEDILSYIDLALDLWVTPDGEQTILDEDELEALQLDEQLTRQVYAGLHALQAELKTKNPPA